MRIICNSVQMCRLVEMRCSCTRAAGWQLSGADEASCATCIVSKMRVFEAAWTCSMFYSLCWGAFWAQLN